MMKDATSLAAMILLVAATVSTVQATDHYFTGAGPAGWVGQGGSSFADGNCDGVVDDDDLSILLSHWGQCGVTWREGDLSGNGCVDDDDLSELLASWDPVFDPICGDANLDGVVNDADLSIMFSH